MRQHELSLHPQYLCSTVEVRRYSHLLRQPIHPRNRGYGYLCIYVCIQRIYIYIYIYICTVFMYCMLTYVSCQPQSTPSPRFPIAPPPVRHLRPPRKGSPVRSTVEASSLFLWQSNYACKEQVILGSRVQGFWWYLHNNSNP